jgi:hypothetical protein
MCVCGGGGVGGEWPRAFLLLSCRPWKVCVSSVGGREQLWERWFGACLCVCVCAGAAASALTCVAPALLDGCSRLCAAPCR